MTRLGPPRDAAPVGFSRWGLAGSWAKRLLMDRATAMCHHSPMVAPVARSLATDPHLERRVVERASGSWRHERDKRRERGGSLRRRSTRGDGGSARGRHPAWPPCCSPWPSNVSSPSSMKIVSRGLCTSRTGHQTPRTAAERLTSSPHGLAADNLRLISMRVTTIPSNSVKQAHQLP